MEAWSTDIPNVYLEAFTPEKVCITAGPEFGPLQRHLLIAVKALYGLMTSSVYWHERLADVLRNEGFLPCKAEPDIWLQKSDSIYEYTLESSYMDNLAVTMRTPKEFIETLKDNHNFKNKAAGPLQFCLGAEFYHNEEGTICMAPQKYIERLTTAYKNMYGEKPSL